MAITPDDVRTIAPELAGETDARINFFISEASLYINRAIWKGKSDFAHMYYTAHLMTISNQAGAAGALTEEKVGDLSRKFGGGGGGGSLDSTSYGLQFKAFQKTLLISPIIVNGRC